MSNTRVPAYSNPPSTRVLVTPDTRGIQVKPEPVTGFARPGCTRRVPGFRSSGVRTPLQQGDDREGLHTTNTQGVP